MITIASTKKKEPVPPLVRLRDVATLLSVSRQTVHALIASGDLEASNMSPSNAPCRKSLRVTRKSLFAFYKERCGRPLNAVILNPTFEP